MIKWGKSTQPKEGEEVIVYCDGEEYVATFCYSGMLLAIITYPLVYESYKLQFRS